MTVRCEDGGPSEGLQLVLFLLSGQRAVDAPVVAGVAATLELLHPDQGHAVGLQLRDAVPGRPPQVQPVEAEAALVAVVVVGVGVSVPRVAAVLRLPQLLPHVADAVGKAHLAHLNKSIFITAFFTASSERNDGRQRDTDKPQHPSGWCLLQTGR